MPALWSDSARRLSKVLKPGTGSGGSLLVCFIFHAIYNATVTTVSLMFPGAPIMFGVIGLLWATVLLILLRRGCRRFAPTDGESNPES